MEATTVQEQDSSDTQRKEINRSASYPFVTVEAALVFAVLLYGNYTRSLIKREDADAVNNLGYTNRYLAACVQYGLLTRDKEGYRLTDLFIGIHKPENENERRESLIIAFSNPKLYKALISSYDGHAIPAELPTILFRKYDIADAASKSAADIFIENGRFVGAIDDKNILRVATAKERLSTTQFAEVTTVPNDNNGVRQESPTNIPQLLLTPHHVNEIAETEIINLPDREKATLTFPPNITLKGILLIRKRLDEIELRIKEEGTA
jgi:hypothetical protein